MGHNCPAFGTEPATEIKEPPPWPRDRGFESGFLQQGVYLSSAPRGCRRKAPHFGGILRVAGDVRRDVQAANRDSFARSL
jgi:hypothetical protein